ncbi:hypothetical protein IAU60_003413 [Kwoniella sp. DSM 27419]
MRTMLTARAIAETPLTGRSRHVKPSDVRQLIGKGELACLTPVDVSPPEMPKLDEALILKLRPTYHAKDIARVKQFMQDTKLSRDAYIELSKRKPHDHPIWDIWEQTYKAELHVSGDKLFFESLLRLAGAKVLKGREGDPIKPLSAYSFHFEIHSPASEAAHDHLNPLAFATQGERESFFTKDDWLAWDWAEVPRLSVDPLKEGTATPEDMHPSGPIRSEHHTNLSSQLPEAPSPCSATYDHGETHQTASTINVGSVNTKRDVTPRFWPCDIDEDVKRRLPSPSIVYEEPDEEIDELDIQEYAVPLAPPRPPEKPPTQSRGSRPLNSENQERNTKSRKRTRKRRKLADVIESCEDFFLSIPEKVFQPLSAITEDGSTADPLAGAEGVRLPQKINNGHSEIPHKAANHQWTTDPRIKNPKWYSKSMAYSLLSAGPLPILIAPTVLQNIWLLRALNDAGFQSVEYEDLMQGADIVISPSTAVVLTRFTDLRRTHHDVLQPFKHAADYYTRILLIFEVMPSTKPSACASVDDCSNPMTSESIAGLEALRRGITHAFDATSQRIGRVDILFAHGGPCEVARALVYKQHLEATAACNANNNPKEHRKMWGARGWLHGEFDRQLVDKVVEKFRINTFCAIYALYRYNQDYTALAESDVAGRQRILEPAFGSVIAARMG